MGEDVLAEESELRIHHPLHDGGGIDARQVVVLEGGHEGERAGGHHELVRIDIEDLLRSYILDGEALTLQDVPDDTVQEDAFPGVAGEGFGDVEAAHAAELPLLLEKEELVRLHPELAADGVVVVDHEVIDPRLAELLADGEAGRTRADDGDGGLVHPLRRPGIRGHDLGEAVGPGAVHLFHAVHLGDADAADVAVHDHFARAALADAALHRAVAVLQAVVVDGESGLVQGGGDGLALLSGDGMSFKDKRMQILLRNFEDRMLRNFVHVDVVSSVFRVTKLTILNEKPHQRDNYLPEHFP